MFKRVIFARVGWSEKYDGAKSRAEWPIGGGSNNKKRCGDEVHNFTKIGGRIYGFCQPAVNSKRGIKPERVQPGFHGEILPNVLIVFVAVHPEQRGQRVVGWYRNASLYSEHQPSLSPKRKKLHYSAVTKAGDAVLLPVDRRDWRVRAGTGGIGQVNICYLYKTNGRSKGLRWAARIIRAIKDWRPSNTRPRRQK